MIDLTLELNRKCNLRCTYCYIEEKDNQEMDLVTAEQAIDFAVAKIEQQCHKNRSIKVNFLGGEPLLSFPLMKQVVAYCGQQAQQYGIDFHFSVTTNGTICNDEILSFLVRHRSSLKVSLDGPKEVNDANRITPSGEGSYDLVIKNFPYFSAYEKSVQKHIQLSSVTTKESYQNYYNNIIFFTGLGFRYIDSGMDTRTSDWNSKELSDLKEQIEQALLYFMDCHEAGNPFFWTFIDTAYKRYKNTYRLYFCGSGIIQFYIKHNGDIHMCPTVLDKKYKLGTIGHVGNSEFYKQTILAHKNIKKLDNTVCSACEYEQWCSAKGCFAASIVNNGSVHKPNKLSCEMFRFRFDLVKKYEQRLEKIMVSFDRSSDS